MTSCTALSYDNAQSDGSRTDINNAMCPASNDNDENVVDGNVSQPTSIAASMSSLQTSARQHQPY